MDAIPWILIGIVALIILLGVLVIYWTKKKKLPRREPDYYVWFWIGICWIGAGTPLGVNFNNWGLSIMGLVFLIVGLAHKKDWKKNHVKWKDLKSTEKKFKMWLMILLGIILLGGFAAYLVFR